jgi:hypothetical protein
VSERIADPRPKCREEGCPFAAELVVIVVPLSSGHALARYVRKGKVVA